MKIPQNKAQYLFRTRSGTSLLIGLGVVGVILLIAMGITTAVIVSIRDSSNVNNANKAYYAAEGALEAGLLENQKVGAGFTGSTETVRYSENANLHGTYQIQGQVRSNTRYPLDGTYGVPTPGTGTAGTNCNTISPEVSGSFTYPPAIGGVSYIAQDHPCNWNRIYPNETATIPLYVTTSDPDSTCPEDPDNPGYKVCNPIDLGLTSLRIRVRTPCRAGTEMCAPVERYNLDLTNGDPQVQGNDTILDWQITGRNRTGDKIYLLTSIKDYDDTLCRDAANLYGRCDPLNTEIYESLINVRKSNGNTVLTGTRGGEEITANFQKGTIMNFLRNVAPWDIGGTVRPSADDTIYKPMLHLRIIHSLSEESTENVIPFLEYQVLMNAATLPPTNTFQTITAEGYSGSFKQVLEVKQPQGAGSLEYVIQQ